MYCPSCKYGSEACDLSKTVRCPQCGYDLVKVRDTLMVTTNAILRKVKGVEEARKGQESIAPVFVAIKRTTPKMGSKK